MSALMTLTGAFRTSRELVMKAAKPKRFDREKASEPLQEDVARIWRGGIAALFEHLDGIDAWPNIRAHVLKQAPEVEKSEPRLSNRIYSVMPATACSRARFSGSPVQKALSDADLGLIAELLANFGYPEQTADEIRALLEANGIETFEAAAQLALKNVGIVGVDFTLRNEAIRERLLARAFEGVLASRKNIEAAMETIVRNFYELGKTPFDQDFLESLKSDLQLETDWQARRLAVTETGIAAESGQREAMKRNGAELKTWNALFQNTRESHAVLNGVTIPIDDKFPVGDSEGEGPMDPDLPAHELINCQCWLTYALEGDVDPADVWAGE